MERHEPRGTVHWIDHFIVGTNDMVTWVDWAVNATGITRRPIRGITTTARKKDVPIMCFLWWEGESCRIGAFLQPEVYPSGKPLGEDTPRCGFYIRPEDVDAHLKRLDRHNIPHTDPVRTADGGDEGTVIYFADPDGNQFEFWAPDHMPEGAMEICTSEGVGRISHAVYGSRDLGKTANFFETYCALQPEGGPNVAEGSLVLRLQAGGRLIYKLVDQVDERVAGHGAWWDMHTALTVRAEEFMPNYRRMWETLPEEAMAKEDDSLSLEEEDALPAAHRPAPQSGGLPLEGDIRARRRILRLGRPRVPLLRRQARERRRLAGALHHRGTGRVPHRRRRRGREGPSRTRVNLNGDFHP